MTLTLRSPSRQDFTFRPVSNDIYTFDEIFIDEVYGSTVCSVPNVETVLDLGANIGLASLYFLMRYPSCRVFAVEPDPRNYKILTENLSKYREFGRATTLSGAYWPRDEEVVFSVPAEPGYVNQGAVLGGLEHGKLEARMTVQGFSMPSLIGRSGFKSIELLKVDIEGAERELFGADLSWLDAVNAIAIEFHDGSRKESGFDEVVKYHGFTLNEQGSHTVLARRGDRRAK